MKKYTLNQLDENEMIAKMNDESSHSRRLNVWQKYAGNYKYWKSYYGFMRILSFLCFQLNTFSTTNQEMKFQSLRCV